MSVTLNSLNAWFIFQWIWIEFCLTISKMYGISIINFLSPECPSALLCNRFISLVPAPGSTHLLSFQLSWADWQWWHHTLCLLHILLQRKYITWAANVTYILRKKLLLAFFILLYTWIITWFIFQTLEYYSIRKI